MIETAKDLKSFLNDCKGDLIVQIIPESENCHPFTSIPSIIFLYCIESKKTYYYSFTHPDSIPNVSEIGSDYFKNEFLLKLKNRMWALDKKVSLQLIPLNNLYDINLCGFLLDNETIDYSEYETPAHRLIKGNNPNEPKINRIIPLMKHLETFTSFCSSVSRLIKKFEIDSGYINLNDVVIPTLANLEEGIFVDRAMFLKRFNIDVGEKQLTYSQYNIYTNTGRPSNRFGGVNYAALNTKDGTRECFISRFGKNGKMILMDYTSFHPRIICKLVNYKLDVNVNIYEYLARLYFNKTAIDDIDISESKKLTFKQLYGGIDDKYSHIKYLSNLKEYITNDWNFFKTNGYVLTPFFKRKITSKHISDPNPNKLFNYILQATEGEIAIPKIRDIQKYLENKKSKAILYTYDSILFDFHKDDGMDTFINIKTIMSCNGEFPIKTYMGNSYQSLKEVIS